MQQLRNVAAEELDVAAAELDAEQREDEELRTHYGERWKRPASTQLTAGMRDRIQGYKANLAAASDSDAKYV